MCLKEDFKFEDNTEFKVLKVVSATYCALLATVATLILVKILTVGARWLRIAIP